MLKFNLLFLCLCSLFIELKTQDFCFTPPIASMIDTTLSPLKSDTVDAVTIRIALHPIRKSDGTGGLTGEQLTMHVEHLRRSFYKHGICFEVVNISDVNNNIFYSADDFGVFKSPFFNSNAPLANPERFYDYDGNSKIDVLEIYCAPDRLDIFFSPPEGETRGGFAVTIPSTSCVVGGKQKTESSADTTASYSYPFLIAHEVGHCLGLHHTFAGNCQNYTPNGGNSNAQYLPEDPVDRSKCKTTGDLVCDTGADNTQGFTQNETCGNSLEDVCVNGQNPYGNLPYGNFMDYIPYACATNFTPEQGGRIRYMVTKEAKGLFQAILTDNRPNLFVRDNLEDVGWEPDNRDLPIWTAPDISLSGDTTYYDEGGQELNVIKLKVENIGCASAESSKINLHWAKAHAGDVAYPERWNGGTFPGLSAKKGDKIGSELLPTMKTGQKKVINFTWNAPNPDDYTDISAEPWHFCLLSRVEGDLGDEINDSDNTGEGYVRNNNNVAIRNVVVIPAPSYKKPNDKCPEDLFVANGASVLVDNSTNLPKVYSLNFANSNKQQKASEALDLYISLSDGLYEKWVAGGKLSTGVAEMGIVENVVSYLNNSLQKLGVLPLNEIENRKVFNVIGDNVSFQNLALLPGEHFSASILPLFPADNSGSQAYSYNVSQQVLGSYVGGTSFIIQTPQCKSVSKSSTVNTGVNCEYTLSPPASFSSCASYQWYDEVGNLLSTDISYTNSSLINRNIDLVVVEENGCTYGHQYSVEITEANCILNSPVSCVSSVNLYPNPARDDVIYVEINSAALPSNEGQEVNITITDAIFGSEFVQVKETLFEENAVVPVIISELGFGVYRLTVTCPSSDTNPYSVLFNKR